jgi:hypothetical protein
MKLWMIAINIASPEKLMLLMLMLKEVLEAKKAAWNAFIEPIVEEQKQLVGLLES